MEFKKKIKKKQIPIKKKTTLEEAVLAVVENVLDEVMVEPGDKKIILKCDKNLKPITKQVVGDFIFSDVTLIFDST